MTAHCSGSLRVDDGNAAASALIHKLEGSGCGARMLDGQRPVPRIEIDTIRHWIDSGAFLHDGSHGSHGAGH